VGFHDGPSPHGLLIAGSREASVTNSGRGLCLPEARVVRLGSSLGARVLAAAVLSGVGVALAATAVGFHAMRVASGSMSPSIDRGDWILVRDLNNTERASFPRGDVVVFRFPLGTTGRAIKRVVAIGGDTVKVGPRAISVNGHRIPIAGAPNKAAARHRVEHIPAGHVFLLGNNTPLSIDSRSLGPIPDTELVARVLFVAPSPLMLSLLLLAIAITATTCGIALARHRRT
jgi:signal peptidase I